MAYKQWTTISVENNTNKTLTVRDAGINGSGKFYEADSTENKDQEKSTDDINSVTIGAHKTYKFGACGRANESAGPDGHFDLYADGDKVATFRFSSPWGLSSNVFHIENVKSGFTFKDRDANLSSDGPLGNITVTVTN